MLIYLVRHALARYDTGVPYGTPPGPPLSDVGLEQAAATASLLQYAGLERIVSSPMRRCTMTAEPLAALFGLDLEIDDDLGEQQSNETQAEVTVRMLRAMLNQIDRGTTALVGHAAPIEFL